MALPWRKQAPPAPSVQLVRDGSTAYKSACGRFKVFPVIWAGKVVRWQATDAWTGHQGVASAKPPYGPSDLRRKLSAIVDEERMRGVTEPPPAASVHGLLPPSETWDLDAPARDDGPGKPGRHHWASFKPAKDEIQTCLHAGCGVQRVLHAFGFAYRAREEDQWLCGQGPPGCRPGAEAKMARDELVVSPLGRAARARIDARRARGVVAPHRSADPSKWRLRVGEPDEMTVCSCGCGAQIRAHDSVGRRRYFLPGHNGGTHRMADASVQGRDPPKPERVKVLLALGRGLSNRVAIAELLGMKIPSVAIHCTKALHAGEVEHLAYGRWQLTDRGRACIANERALSEAGHPGALGAAVFVSLEAAPLPTHGGRGAASARDAPAAAPAISP